MLKRYMLNVVDQAVKIFPRADMHAMRVSVYNSAVGVQDTEPVPDMFMLPGGTALTSADHANFDLFAKVLSMYRRPEKLIVPVSDGDDLVPSSTLDPAVMAATKKRVAQATVRPLPPLPPPLLVFSHSH